MLQCRFKLASLTLGILSGISIGANAAVYEVIDLGEPEFPDINSYALSSADSSFIVGAGAYNLCEDQDDDGICDCQDDEEENCDNNVDTDDDDDDSEDSQTTGDDDNLGSGNEEDSDDIDDKKKKKPEGNYHAYYWKDDKWKRITVFDELDSESNKLTGTTFDYLFNVNSNQLAVGYGTGPYRYYEWKNKSETEYARWLREFDSHGFTYNAQGKVSTLTPLYDTHGGNSGAYAINDNNLAVGYSSVGITASSEDYIKNTCLKDGGHIQAYCDSLAVFTTRAVAWQLDVDGAVQSVVDLGLAFEPKPDDDGDNVDFRFVSQAYQLNDRGVIVGRSHNYEQINEGDKYYQDQDYVDYYAIIWEPQGDGKYKKFDITDREEYYRSYAMDVNNSDIVVGHAFDILYGYSRTKAFYYDINGGERYFTELPSLYDSSGSTANAINNKGTIVGEYEYEYTPSSSIRRRHGYLYNMGDKSLTDLNKLTQCNSKYEVVEANSIADDGTILGTASYEVQARDANGNLAYSESTGKPIMTVVVRGVMLKPIPGGTIDECPVEVPDPVERKGASMPWWMLFAGFGLFAWRRR